MLTTVRCGSAPLSPVSVWWAFAWIGSLGCACTRAPVGATGNGEIVHEEASLRTPRSLSPTYLVTPEAEAGVSLGALPWQPGAALVEHAVGLFSRGDVGGALALVRDVDAPAAALMRARIRRQQGDLTAARRALVEAAAGRFLEPLVLLERGRVALADGAWSEAIEALRPLLALKEPVAQMAVEPLTAALLASHPRWLLELHANLQAVVPPEDEDGRARLLVAKAAALELLGRGDEALAVRQQQYIEEPVAAVTPDVSPAGASPSALDLLDRAERLVLANRNDRAQRALESLRGAEFDAAARCRWRFLLGLCARKLRQYGDAEAHLSVAARDCQELDLARRAAYLHAKVVSIRDGLRAIAPIEAFVSRFFGHSMVDDVLFWAGDLFQQRGRFVEASSYYSRAEGLAQKGDHCAVSRWRLGWMAYQRNDFAGASAAWDRVLLGDGCAPEPAERARAQYWLGRIEERQRNLSGARERYGRVLTSAPLGYYAQLALGRLLATVSGSARSALLADFATPSVSAAPPLCPGVLAEDPFFLRGLSYLLVGLTEDAARSLSAASVSQGGQRVVRAEAPVPKGLGSNPSTADAVCSPTHGALLLTLLLDRAGAHRMAHWQLRTTFSSMLTQVPTPREVSLWRVAYPLAHRDVIARSEDAFGIPPFLLQALVREESAFDVGAVSWAGAYGLTQVLPRTAIAVAKTLPEPMSVPDANVLLEAETNVTIGGALLGALLRRFGDAPVLALSAYNAGDVAVGRWLERGAGEETDAFVEAMTIRESRRYVKRVLQTYGIYRWLYEAGLPALPAGEKIPKAL